MSLTTLLNRTELRQRFKRDFPKPAFKIDKEIVSVPLTKNYTLIGTAFDYLLRFYIQRLNRKNVIHKEWVASSVASDYQFQKTQNSFYSKNDRPYINKNIDIVINIHEKALISYNTYLKDGELTDELCKATYGLAQLDHIFRSGYIDPNLGKVEKNDLKDLKKMIQTVDSEIFKAKVCVLNPTFGNSSKMVDGADADLIVNNTLIDIKTTKSLELTRDQYNQLIGYYCLYRLDKIDGLKKSHKITSIGIYYSRFGYLVKFDINDIEGINNLPLFLKWFKRMAKKYCRHRNNKDFLGR